MPRWILNRIYAKHANGFKGDRLRRNAARWHPSPAGRKENWTRSSPRACDDDRQDEVNREPRQIRERKFKYAEGVTEISLGLEQSDYPR